MLLLAALPVRAKVLLSADEALRLAFPGCEVTREAVFLTDAQLERARGAAGVEVPSALVTRWVARHEGTPAGTAYLDTHVVRTLPETLLVVLDPRGAVRRVEVLSFSEPEEYLPRGTWYEQFQGRDLGPTLTLRGVIRPVTGATLSARAATDAVRRVLAVHHAITEGPGK